MENHNLQVYVSDGVKLKDPSLVSAPPTSSEKSPFDNKLKSVIDNQSINVPKITYFDSWINAVNAGYNQSKLKENTNTSEKSGVSRLEINPKEYVDGRIDSLEKSIDLRFEANEKLISEKIDHLHTKFEMTLESKLGDLKDSIFSEQATQTQNNRSNMIGIIGVAAAVIIGVITILLTAISIAIAIYL